ncbi:hypothetical protein EIJ81_08195 [Aliivibrio salmonicida]|uniref:hypothetical protein n=1 Tax=Aliivibrio salmonicida TaxID=40269 RepID=UPI0002E5D722|nr:hypothetical protein [Aliivibrio salmonicida]AZL86166.1 hypothetical protein EIJ81_08195 [Aliivibrio salmonicida]
MVYIIACFIVGILGVLFGGIILGYTLDSLLAGNLQIGDAATWLAAISTLGAAIGTIGSLIMLNRQHNQNVIHQKRVWKKQEESLDFARYREHKVQFEQLLDTLEDKHSDFYVFKDRTKLYLNLFPNNSPRNELATFKYKLTRADLMKQHPLDAAWKNIDKVDRILRTHGQGRLIIDENGERLEKFPNPLPIHQIEHSIFNTAGSLGLRCNRIPQTGDLVNTDEVFASVFDTMLMRSHSADIFESLNEFCGLESPRERGVIYSPIDLGFQLLNYYKREDTPEYNSIISGHYRIVTILFELDRLVKLLPQEHPLVLFVRNLYGAPWDKTLLKDIDDKGRVKHYMNQVFIQLGDILEGEQKASEAVKQQAQYIFRYIQDQASYENSPF